MILIAIALEKILGDANVAVGDAAGIKAALAQTLEKIGGRAAGEPVVADF